MKLADNLDRLKSNTSRSVAHAVGKGKVWSRHNAHCQSVKLVRVKA